MQTQGSRRSRRPRERRASWSRSRSLGTRTVETIATCGQLGDVRCDLDRAPSASRSSARAHRFRGLVPRAIAGGLDARGRRTALQVALDRRRRPCRLARFEPSASRRPEFASMRPAATAARRHAEDEAAMPKIPTIDITAVRRVGDRGSPPARTGSTRRRCRARACRGRAVGSRCVFVSRREERARVVRFGRSAAWWPVHEAGERSPTHRPRGILSAEWRAGGASATLPRLPVCRIVRPPRRDVCTTLLLQRSCSRLSPKEVG